MLPSWLPASPLFSQASVYLGTWVKWFYYLRTDRRAMRETTWGKKRNWNREKDEEDREWQKLQDSPSAPCSSIFLCICLIPFSAVTCLYSVFHMLAPERAQCNSIPFKRPSEGCTRAAAGRAGSRQNKFPGLLYHGGSTPTPTAPSTAREEGGPVP